MQTVQDSPLRQKCTNPDGHKNTLVRKVCGACLLKRTLHVLIC